MVQLKFSEFTGKFSKFTVNFGRCMAIWGKMPLLGGLHGLWGIYRGQTWCRLVFMASVSVYEGIDSILERINCIFGQFQQQIWADIWLYGGKYHFWEYCVGCRAYIAVRFGAGWCLWQV